MPPSPRDAPAGADPPSRRPRPPRSPLPDTVLRCRTDGTVIDHKVVGSVEVLVGDGLTLGDVVGPWAEVLCEIGARARAQGVVLRDEGSLEAAGTRRHYEARVSGIDEGFLVLLRDVTTRRIARDQLARDDRRLQALLAHCADVVLVTDPTGRPTWVSPSVSAVLGHDPTTFLARAPRLVHADDRPELRRLAEALTAAPGDVAGATLRLRHADGSWRWVELVASNRLDDPVVEGFVVTGRDVTERVRQAEVLTHLARHDALTGLPNRVLLQEELARACARSDRLRTRCAVLFVDLDHFKVVNDSLGHAAGDELLRAVAERLKASVRATDVVSRFGGDEFVVLCEPVVDEADALRVARRFVAVASGGFAVAGRQLGTTMSVGIAVQGPRSTPGSLLRDADAAAHRAKQRGRDRVELFDDALRAAAQARLSVESDLRHGIAEHHIEAHYQPVIDLTTMSVTGFEALARWHHPTRGLVSPSDFIAVAEETGQIVPLGTQVLRQACRQLAGWSRDLPIELVPTMSINVAARQISDGGFADLVDFVLEESGAPPERVILEVTESDLVQEIDLTAGQLDRLRERGVRVALDDFGAGWSSLGQLRALPIDILKVDRQFTRSLRDDPAGAAVVEAVVRLAAALGLGVVAEGVETRAELDGLRGVGCPEAQGFLFSPAVTAARADTLLATGGGGRATPGYR